jgi:hypothetical protein
MIALDLQDCVELLLDGEVHYLFTIAADLGVDDYPLT